MGKCRTKLDGSRPSFLSHNSLQILIPETCISQNVLCTYARDLLLKDLVSASTMAREYVRTKKHQETEIRSLVIRKQNSVFRNRIPFPLETKFCFRKWNSVSTQNKILFPGYITL